MNHYIDQMEQLMRGIKTWQGVVHLEYQYNLRECVYQYQQTKLFHYQAKKKNIGTLPLLIVFATINRPEILDLFPDKSFINGLLNQGVDVYLLDWGRFKNNFQFDNYIHEYLANVIKFIIQSRQQEKINLLGICQGGVISLCYAALYQQIKNLILISTPIDFHTKDHVISKLLKHINTDLLLDKNKIPGKWLTDFFISLRPFELIGKKYFQFNQRVDDQAWINNFLQIEKWLYDVPDQPVIAFTKWIRDFYQHNKLIKGEIFIQGKQIDLKKITMPILNLMTSHDGIVPASASQVLKKHVASNDVTQKKISGGHIGVYINEQSTLALSQTISNWLKKRD